MSTLTIRLPDDTAQRLKLLAKRRGLSVNKLVEELSVQAIAFDAESRAQAMAVQGDPILALSILARLDGQPPPLSDSSPDRKTP